ncbi:uncharacterized protein N7518_003946 [Penicillium psychrosexuale]|uniref:uncharacterized protein n=1 Tax=Penicillium psychrosexuale TaxID=1002107 RepID=UPI002544FBA7|nr:uncharacterized protein N7518_003946 [Penicillium psychrosexuale]KAJ5795406.1 hypothetical protein N7518_003946 [Penicillium psychrosexuale]
MADSTGSRNSLPPPPPPPPPPPENPCSKISPTVLKMRSTSPSHFFQPQVRRSQNQGPAPTGPYFFYGSLQDQNLLIELLDLSHAPHLRPAYIEGYKCKLWGHYPALLSGDPVDTVTGAVYEVLTFDDAEKLAAYEGPSYTTVACSIRYADGESPTQAEGYAFLFVGNTRDLSEGSFDFKLWLERRALGRKS